MIDCCSDEAGSTSIRKLVGLANSRTQYFRGAKAELRAKAKITPKP